MNALNAQDETFQTGIYASEVQNQEQMQMQSEIFDQMMNERSENMREVDTLRNVDMTQRKAEHTRNFETYDRLLGIIATMRDARTASSEGAPPA
jgi:hypothetical protein